MTLASHSPNVVTGPSGADYECRTIQECDEHLHALAIAAATARPRHPRLAAKYLADADEVLDRRMQLVEAQVWASLK